ncbi:peptidylprolyl isomerase [Angustibacter speluncae]
MSPSKREREYARRRYADWQERQSVRAERRRRVRNVSFVVAGVLVPVLVIGLVWWLANRGDDGTDVATTPTETETTEPAADNPCPEVTTQPNPEPAQFPAAPDPSVAEGRTWTATITTTCGDITLELDGALAPQSVANFVQLARDGFYDSTPCHRLTVEGIFVLQCGDPTGTGQGGPGYSWGPIENAPADDLYPAGTLAMARVGGDAESQGSQFFLVYEDSTIPSDEAGGYSVFGRITGGLDIVQKIAAGGVGADGTAPAFAISIEGVTAQ